MKGRDFLFRRNIVFSDNCSLNLSEASVYCHGVSHPLSEKQFKLLKSLVSNEGQVLTFDQIIAYVWGNEYVPDNDRQGIRDLVTSIRKIYPEIGKRIQARKGIGYVISINDLLVTSEIDNNNPANPSLIHDQLIEGISLFSNQINTVYAYKVDTNILPNVKNIDTSIDTLGLMSVYDSIKSLWNTSTWNCLYLGKSGSGKTMSLFWVIQKLITEHPTLPIFYINVEEYCQLSLTNGFFEYIYSKYIHPYGINLSIHDIKEYFHSATDRRPIPAIIVILDGLSNYTLRDTTEFQNELDILRSTAGIQLLMTSNSKMHPFILGDITIKKYHVQDLTVQQIHTYLTSMNLTWNEQKIPYILLSNPMLLTIYAQTNQFMQNQRSNILNYIRPDIYTESDILWNLLETITVRYCSPQKNEIEQLKISFILRVAIPYVAVYMEIAEITEISSREFFTCVDEATQLLSGDFGEVFDEYFGYEDEITFTKIECKQILDTNLIYQTGFLRRNSHGKYQFSNLIFLHFFAAVYLYRQIIISNSIQKPACALEKSFYNHETLRYLGELCNEYKNTPYISENESVWHAPEARTEILKSLELFRYRFDNNAKTAVSNLIYTIKIARNNDLSGLDLSHLDLRRNTFSHVICSHSNESSSVHTNFDGALIDRWNFCTPGFCNDLCSSVFQKSKNRIYLTFSTKEIYYFIINECTKINSITLLNDTIQHIDLSATEDKLLITYLREGLVEFSLDNRIIINHLKIDALLRSAIYIGNDILYITRDKKIYIYRNDTEETSKIIDCNANNVTGYPFFSLITSRVREVYEYNYDQKNIVFTYHLENAADSYITEAQYSSDFRSLIGSTKDGYVVEWNYHSPIPKTSYHIGGSIDSFALSDDENLIFAASDNGSLYSINRLTETISQLHHADNERWSECRLFNQTLYVISIEGTVGAYDMTTNLYKTIKPKSKNYNIPYLHMAGCTFGTPHPDSKIDKQLITDLRAQKILI